MKLQDSYCKLKSSFALAKQYAKDGNAEYARKCIIDAMETLKDIYIAVPSAKEKNSAYARILEFRDVAVELRDKGVTPNVKKFFGIESVPEEPKRVSTAKESAKAAPAKQSQPVHVEIEENVGLAESIFKEQSAAVVEIRCNAGRTRAVGTGFFISNDGYLLTNHHVVFDDDEEDYYEKISCLVANGGLPRSVEVIASDPGYDVALCKVEPLPFDKAFTPVVRTDDYSKVLPGASVVAIGNGLSMGLAPIMGTVKFPRNNEDNLVTTLPINNGDSGSPVFDRRGVCIGIVKSATVAVKCGGTTVQANNVSNAVPMSIIDELLDRWCKQYNVKLRG